MDRAATFDRLGEIGEPTRPLLARALEVTASFETKQRADTAWAKESALYRDALVAAGIASIDLRANLQAGIAHAGSFTREQRTVIEILAQVPGPDLHAMRVPRAAWARRQWIGSESPGPLFSIELDGEPAWHALHRAGALGAQRIQSLPVSEAVRLAVEVQLLVLDLACGPSVGALLVGLCPRIGSDMGAWGREQAERLVALFAPSTPSTERGTQTEVPAWVAFAVLLALARAGETIEPRWEALFPAAPWIKPDWYRECLAAIDAARRDTVLEAALARVNAPRLRVEAGLPMLSAHPTARLACLLLDLADEARKPKDVRAAVKVLAAKHPEIRAALDAKKGGVPAPLLSVVTVRDAITLASLDAIDRAQLEHANVLYGGRKKKAADLFAEEDGAHEQIKPALTRHVRIDRDGRPAYDAWLSMGDSGTVFDARTTRVVAEIVQANLECADGALRSALREALASAPEGARRARPKTRKKGQNAKPAVKKPKR